MGTPRSLFSTDSHFLIMRNRVDVHPAVPERLGVGDLGWRRAPERERDWWWKERWESSETGNSGLTFGSGSGLFLCVCLICLPFSSIRVITCWCVCVCEETLLHYACVFTQRENAGWAVFNVKSVSIYFILQEIKEKVKNRFEMLNSFSVYSHRDDWSGSDLIQQHLVKSAEALKRFRIYAFIFDKPGSAKSIYSPNFLNSLEGIRRKSQINNRCTKGCSL